MEVAESIFLSPFNGLDDNTVTGSPASVTFGGDADVTFDTDPDVTFGVE